jgi:NADPH:quinone reductase-like Zn-dependent oxidoreductase
VEHGPGLAERVRTLAPEGVAAAVDTVGRDEAVDVSVDLVGDLQRIVTIASFEHGARRGIVRIGSGPGADPGTALRDAARLDLVRAVEAGTLRVVQAGTFPLAEAAQAHRAIQGRHAPGKFALLT